MVCVLVFFLVIFLFARADGASVGEVISSEDCDLKSVSKLSLQILREARCLNPSFFMSLSLATALYSVSAPDTAFLYLKTEAAKKFLEGIGELSEDEEEEAPFFGVQGALTTLVEQHMKKVWSETGKCEFEEAEEDILASKEESGAVLLGSGGAVVSEYLLSGEGGFEELSGGYEFKGVDGVEARNLIKAAFISLYNANNPTQLADTGDLSTFRDAIERSPAEGYEKMGCGAGDADLQSDLPKYGDDVRVVCAGSEFELFDLPCGNPTTSAANQALHLIDQYPIRADCEGDWVQVLRRAADEYGWVKMDDVSAECENVIVSTTTRPPPPDSCQDTWEEGEECDGGTGCDEYCECSLGWHPTTPPSAACEKDCGNNRWDGSHEQCDGGEGCNDQCECELEWTAKNPRESGCAKVSSLATCGNGVVDEANGEVCDGGENCAPRFCKCTQGYRPTTPKSLNCEAEPEALPDCGNGIVEPSAGEECDGGTGCDPSLCVCLGPDWVAKSPPSLSCGVHIPPKCGNFRVNPAIDGSPAESCDGGEGCEVNCQCKEGFVPRIPKTLACEPAVTSAESTKFNVNDCVCLHSFQKDITVEPCVFGRVASVTDVQQRMVVHSKTTITKCSSVWLQVHLEGEPAEKGWIDEASIRSCTCKNQGGRDGNQGNMEESESVNDDGVDIAMIAGIAGGSLCCCILVIVFIVVVIWLVRRDSTPNQYLK